MRDSTESEADPQSKDGSGAIALLPVRLPSPSDPQPLTGRVYKSVLALPEPRRARDRDHLKLVANQPCLVCARTPSQAHHLRIAQPRALGRKVSDEFTVPLCALHGGGIPSIRYRSLSGCDDEPERR